MNVMWTCYECHVNMLWMSREHAMNVMWTCYECHVNMLWMSREHAMNVMWTCYECHVNMLWMSCEHAMNFMCHPEDKSLSEWRHAFNDAAFVLIFVIKAFEKPLSRLKLWYEIPFLRKEPWTISFSKAFTAGIFQIMPCLRLKYTQRTSVYVDMSCAINVGHELCKDASFALSIHPRTRTHINQNNKNNTSTIRSRHIQYTQSNDIRTCAYNNQNNKSTLYLAFKTHSIQPQQRHTYMRVQ